MKSPLAAFLLSVLLALPVFSAGSTDLKPTEITSDDFESVMTEKEMTTTFLGNVVVTGSNIRITCDRLVVVSIALGGDKDQLVAKQSRFKSLVATGRVKIEQEERTASCGRAEVFPDEDRITLTENPIVEDKAHKVTWTGDYLWLLRGERRVQGKNARIIGPPIKDLGIDKETKAKP